MKFDSQHRFRYTSIFSKKIQFRLSFSSTTSHHKNCIVRISKINKKTLKIKKRFLICTAAFNLRRFSLPMMNFLRIITRFMNHSKRIISGRWRSWITDPDLENWNVKKQIVCGKASARRVINVYVSRQRYINFPVLLLCNMPEKIHKIMQNGLFSWTLWMLAVRFCTRLLK